MTFLPTLDQAVDTVIKRKPKSRSAARVCVVASRERTTNTCASSPHRPRKAFERTGAPTVR